MRRFVQYTADLLQYTIQSLYTGLCSTQLIDSSTRTRKDDLPHENDDIVPHGQIISQDVKQTEIGMTSKYIYLS